MNGERHSLIAYLATLATIAGLTLAAVIIVRGSNFGDETQLAKLIASLAFIGSAVTGLIGVIGTFRPQQRRVEIDNPPSNPVPVEEK